jgi:hypothetical protein
MHQNLKTVTVTLTSYTHKNKEPCSSHSDYYFLICKQFKLKVKKKMWILKKIIKDNFKHNIKSEKLRYVHINYVLIP